MMIKDNTKRYSFLQQDYNDLRRGTFVEHVPRTAAHYQAAAMTGSRADCHDYVKISGSEEVHLIERFKMLLDDLHPDDPRKRAAPTVVGVRVDQDRLKNMLGFVISVNKENWPMCILRVCVDDRLKYDADIRSVLQSVVGEVSDEVDKGEIICSKETIIKELSARILGLS